MSAFQPHIKFKHITLRTFILKWNKKKGASTQEWAQLFSPTLIFFSYCTIKTYSHLHTLHTFAQYKGVYTRFTGRVCHHSNHQFFFFKISWNIKLTLAYVNTARFPSSFRGFPLFLRSAEGNEEEKVHSHLPSRLSWRLEIYFSSHCLHRVGNKLWLPFHFHWTVAD